MKMSKTRTLLQAILIFALAWSASTAKAQDEEQKKKKEPVANPYQLDKNQKSPILIYDVSGGMQVAPLKDRTPKFQIFADGRVIAGGNPGTLVVNGQLTAKELNDVLDMIVKRNDFFGINQKDIEAKIKAGKARIKLADASYTKFAIDIEKGKKAVSIYALFNAAKNFPKMEELIRLKSIEDQLNVVAAKVHLGNQAEEVLRVVNEAVKNKKGYTIAPFTLDELALATRMPEGRFQVRFNRKLQAAGPRPEGAPPIRDLNVIYFKKGKIDAPVVSFYGLPPKK